jgi:MSHA biogenesis protein MshO
MISNKSPQSGFTLVEMIIVMVITGIIGGMVAIFLKSPIQQYMDSARRAELTDIADTAFQRVLRDIRTAVPNSIRLPAPSGSTYIEYLPIKAGGRYRATDIGGTLCGTAGGGNAGDALSFTVADTCFTVIGPAVNAVAGDYIVVGSTQSSGGLPYDQTGSGVLRKITSVSVTGGVQAISITGVLFPPSAQLTSQRFQVVDGQSVSGITNAAVTYACVGTQGTDANGNGQAQLIRYAGYGIIQTPAGAPTATAAILANNVSYCNFVYDVGSYQRDGLVALTLQITESSETVSLYEEVHVNNAP